MWSRVQMVVVTGEVLVAPQRIVRSLCWFAPNVSAWEPERLDRAEACLIAAGWAVQTKRLVLRDIPDRLDLRADDEVPPVVGVGPVPRRTLWRRWDDLMAAGNVTFALDITDDLSIRDVDWLVRLIREAPALTFNFGYVVNNRPGSPLFPCAQYSDEGIAVALQSTSLAAGAADPGEWFASLVPAWDELIDVLDAGFPLLGIDSSVAPMFDGASSLIHHVKRWRGSFEQSVTTDLYLQITDFMRSANPRPAGLCGLMLPCLEDFELAEEYEAGQFDIERNLYVSMHCGLGIDTYPIGIDETSERILSVLQLVRGLGLRYGKPLVIRFVSDGVAAVGEPTNFQNPYLRDVTVRPI